MSIRHALVLAAISAPLLAQATILPPDDCCTGEVFDFGKLISSTSTAPSFTEGTITLTARGYNASNQQKSVIEGLGGLGVSSSFLDIGTVADGEYLTLTFNQQVKLTSLTFSSWLDGVDKAVLSWGSNSLTLTNSNNGLLSSVFDLTGVTGTTFKLQASGSLTSFKLDELCAVPVTAVPEPSTYALMGLGLAGIGFASRRRRAA